MSLIKKADVPAYFAARRHKNLIASATRQAGNVLDTAGHVAPDHLSSAVSISPAELMPGADRTAKS
jgi:hypothetical protein